MKNVIFIVALVFILFGCKTQTKIQYVPVESVRTEYRDNYVRDSIVLYDSIYVKEKGDTVRIEKYKYLYRDKIVRDSVIINDTIQVPYRVDVPGERVNYVNGWQNFQIWLGRILIAAIIVFAGFKLIRYRFKL